MAEKKQFDPFREPSAEERFVSRRDTDLKRFMMAISALQQDSVTPEEKARYFSTLKDSINDIVPVSIIQTLAKVSKAEKPEDIDIDGLGKLKETYDGHKIGEVVTPESLARKVVEGWEIQVDDPLRRGDYDFEGLKPLIPLLPQNWYEVFKEYEKKKLAEEDKSKILERLYKDKIIEPVFSVGSTFRESLDNLVRGVENKHDLLRWPNVQKTFQYLRQMIQENEVSSDMQQTIAKELLLKQIKTVEVAGSAIDAHDRGFLISDITTQFSVNWTDTLNSVLANLQSKDVFGKSIELIVNMRGFSGEHAAVPGHATESFLHCKIDKTDGAKVVFSLTRQGEAISPKRFAEKLEEIGLKMSASSGKYIVN